MRTQAIAVLLSAAALSVVAHPHPPTSSDKQAPRAITEAELQDRQHAAVKRHVQARACAKQAFEYQQARKAKRALAKRGLVKRQATSASTVPIASVTASGTAPHFSSLQNTTCVTAPEVTEGPYYVNNELVRQNVSESQAGVDLTLDIGLIDTRTCTPITDPSTFVEIWHANSDGDYGGFVAESNASAGGSGGQPSSASVSASATSASASLARRQATSSNGTAAGSPTGAMPSGAMPSGGMGGGPSGGGGGGGMSTATSDENSFHRGSWPVNSNGVVEFYTKFPGYYNGRTIHIHTMIHANSTVFSNGTLYSHGGSVRHVGQIFFDDTTTDAVLAVAPYNVERGFNRTTNAEDSILAEENADGNNAYVDITMLGDSVNDGLLGYITIGVDTSHTGSITSTNYWHGSSLSSGVAGSATVVGADAASQTGSTSDASRLRPFSFF